MGSKYSTLSVTNLSCRSNINFTKAQSTPEVLISGRTWTLENGYKIEDYEALYIGKNDKTLASLALSIPAKFWYHTLGDVIKQFDIVTNPWLKRRRYLVEKLKDARTVGIVVATLGIQNYLESLNSIKRVLKEKNKKSYIFSVGKPNPAKLANFPEVINFFIPSRNSLPPSLRGTVYSKEVAKHNQFSLHLKFLYISKYFFENQKVLGFFSKKLLQKSVIPVNLKYFAIFFHFFYRYFFPWVE